MNLKVGGPVLSTVADSASLQRNKMACLDPKKNVSPVLFLFYL